MLASLPMYDFPELRDANDAWWQGIARALNARGITRIPDKLSRSNHLMRQWRSPRLLMSQTCGYPLVRRLRDCVRLVVTPQYRAEGCDRSDYRSVVVVRKGEARNIDDVRGKRLAVNDSCSHSGMNALRALVANRAMGRSFFGEVLVTGSHVRSVELIDAHEADVTAIDCVTFNLLGDVHPDLVRRLDVIAHTRSAPGLPYVTAACRASSRLEPLRKAIFDALSDSRLADVRRKLRIFGAEVRPLTDYARIVEAERYAQSRAYPLLR